MTSSKNPRKRKGKKRSIREVKEGKIIRLELSGGIEGGAKQLRY